MASWLRDLFPEVTRRQRELHVPLQTQISGQKITTHTIQWITRRNYESMHAKYANTRTGMSAGMDQDQGGPIGGPSPDQDVHMANSS